MATITATQCADYWMSWHGPRSRAAEFVGIAMAESSLDTGAVSPAGALGTWQIMPFWFTHFGYRPDEYQNQDIQAIITVAISGMGTNCAAWDSCYDNIYATGRKSFLGYPQAASRAYQLIGVAASLIGDTRHGIPQQYAYPGVTATMAGALADYSDLSGHALPGMMRAVRGQQLRVSRMFRKGAV